MSSSAQSAGAATALPQQTSIAASRRGEIYEPHQLVYFSQSQWNPPVRSVQVPPPSPTTLGERLTGTSGDLREKSYIPLYSVSIRS